MAGFERAGFFYLCRVHEPGGASRILPGTVREQKKLNSKQSVPGNV
jgi:hypothetical protein